MKESRPGLEPTQTLTQWSVDADTPSVVKEIVALSWTLTSVKIKK